MRVVISGATGNVGTSVLAALAGESRVEEIIGIARRASERKLPAHVERRLDQLERDQRAGAGSG
jgi:uncharacterized protein YbjT (DUF2867 family)